MKERESEGIAEKLNRWNIKANNEEGKWKRRKKKGKAVKIEKNKEKEREKVKEMVDIYDRAIPLTGDDMSMEQYHLPRSLLHGLMLCIRRHQIRLKKRYKNAIKI